MSEENLEYEINDANSIKENLTNDDILDNTCFFNDLNYLQNEYNFVDEDNIVAQHIDYFENYKLKMLHHIAHYYKIHTGKIKKKNIVQLIVDFENNTANVEIVYHRKLMCHCMDLLKNDHYFSKFILFNS
jgi:hypothetical protein